MAKMLFGDVECIAHSSIRTKAAFKFLSKLSNALILLFFFYEL
jgi:hypothetical protein